MHPAIAQHRSGITAICQRYRIARLEVFGSAARGTDFDPDRSDADFLVEFAPGVQPGLDSIFGAKADLEALLGRGVDLVEPAAVRNPYVLASINNSRETVYASLDATWTSEVKDRLGAYQRGEVKAVALTDVIAKYQIAPKSA